MKNILHIALLFVLLSCNNDYEKNDHYKQMQVHYEKGHELFSAGEFNESFEELYTAEELAIKLNDSEYYSLIQHHWNSFPNKYALQSLREEKLHLKALEQEVVTGKKNYITYTIALFFVLLTTLIIYLYLKKREHHEETCEQLETMQSDIEKMQEKEKEIEYISKRIFKERFATIDEICNDFYQRADNYSDAERGRRVNRIINKFKSRESLLQLEDIINRYNSNIIIKLREQIPSIKEDDMNIIIYSLANLSNNTISFLTDKPVSYIYTRRSKIKKKIKESNAKDTDWFIEHLK